VDGIEVPTRIARLPRDRRGLPIPVIVLRDTDGQPHFTINDHEVTERLVAARCCAICGERLGAHACFVGGPGSAFHPAGRYFDAPLHHECATFALKTCPYLAMAGRFSKRINGRTLDPDKAPGRVFVDTTMLPGQPVVFVLGDCRRWTRDRAGHFIPDRPWRAVEFWRDGGRIDAISARELIAADTQFGFSISDLTRWQDQ
jgi:hypothetical protein